MEEISNSWNKIGEIEHAFVQIPFELIERSSEEKQLNSSSTLQFIPFEHTPPPKSFSRLMYKAYAHKGKEWKPIVVNRS